PGLRRADRHARRAASGSTIGSKLVAFAFFGRAGDRRLRGYAVHVQAGQASGVVESGPCDRGASVVRTAAGIDQSSPRCSRLPRFHHVVAERTTSLVGLFVVSQTRVLRRTV